MSATGFSVGRMSPEAMSHNMHLSQTSFSYATYFIDNHCLWHFILVASLAYVWVMAALYLYMVLQSGEWVSITLGSSPQHGKSVDLLLNTPIGRVTPQFHVVFDYSFDTTHSQSHIQLPVSLGRRKTTSRHHYHSHWCMIADETTFMYHLPLQTSDCQSLSRSQSRIPSRHDNLLRRLNRPWLNTTSFLHHSWRQQYDQAALFDLHNVFFMPWPMSPTMMELPRFCAKISILICCTKLPPTRTSCT